MQALGMVERFEVVKEHRLGLGPMSRHSIAKAFGFERGKEAFHGRVIVAAGFSTHAGQDVMGFEDAAKQRARRTGFRDRNGAAPAPWTRVAVLAQRLQ